MKYILSKPTKTKNININTKKKHIEAKHNYKSITLHKNDTTINFSLNHLISCSPYCLLSRAISNHTHISTMADKELTVFVVEAGPRVPQKAYTYLFDTLAAKLLKGLKTDYVSIVAFNSKVTNHPLVETGKFRGIDVLVDFETPAYRQLQNIQRYFDNPGAPDPEASDPFQSLVFAISLFQNTKKKAFTRNIVVVTSSDSPMASCTPEKAAGVASLIKDLNIHLVVVCDGLTREKEDKWTLWNAVAATFASNHILTSEQAQNVANLHPPVRKTRPMPVYRGELRFGADFSRILHDTTYVAEQDALCATFRVEVYPAAKADVLVLGAHEYLVDGDKVVRVERKNNHFVWRQNITGENDEEIEKNGHYENDEVDDKKFDKVPVDGTEFTPGFKFLNFDLIALDSDLMDAAKLALTSELDILGFVDVESVPYAYFTDEAFFVVPERSSTLRNLLNHSAFAEALYKKQKAPIVRFVRKTAKEVDVGPLFPVKVKNGNTFCYCYIFIRLPFKEDEKMGHFPPLAKPYVKPETDLEERPQSEEKGKSENKEHAEKKLSAVNKCMEDFIQLKTYQGKTSSKTVIDHFKVILKGSSSSKLALPNPESADKFICSSPGANKFALYLRRMLIQSLLADDYKTFANSDLIDAIREKGATNLLNLENSLAVNSGDQAWLTEIARNSAKASKRLRREIGVKYVRKEDLKAKKPKPAVLQNKGNYGADEGTYGAVPDFGF